ncbi:hypothetical protein E2I00_012121, partial [Balaenoptera physalus]
IEDTRDDLPKTQRSLRQRIQIPLHCHVHSHYPMKHLSVSGVTLSTIGPKPLKPALVNHSQSEDSLAVIGEGEDYFLSLFGDSKKLVHSFHTKKTWKHFSMILEEVGQSRS